MSDKSLKVGVETSAGVSELERYNKTLEAMAAKTEAAAVAARELADATAMQELKQEVANRKTEDENKLKEYAKEVDKQLAEENKKLTETTKEASKADEFATLKKRALHKTFEELNKISPGLGTSLSFLEKGFEKAGYASKGAAINTKEFKVALESAMATILPLLAVMLTIEAVTKYWEMYKTKVEESAKAQEKAYDLIRESSHKALLAAEKLNEALNPKKKTDAEKIEKNLDAELEALDAEQERESAINKANKGKEMATAYSPEQKKQVESKYQTIDQQTADKYKEKKTQAIENATTEADKQIEAAKAKMAKTIVEQSIEYQQAKDNMTELERRKESGVYSQGVIAKQMEEAQKRLTEANNKLAASLEDQANQEGQLGDVQDRLHEKAKGARRKLDFGRGTEKEVRSVESETVSRERLASYQGGKMPMDLGHLASATGKNSEQTKAILDGILKGSLDTNVVIRQLMAQFNALQEEQARLKAEVGRKQVSSTPGFTN